MKNVQYFEENLIGRDFFVTDLHGNHSAFMRLLSYVDFDESIDRVFCGGDVIDRGKQSLRCLELINESWFHSVIGNHEELMYNAVIDKIPSAKSCWQSNGGLWRYDYLSDYILEDAIQNFYDKSSYVIVIGKESPNRVNIVHANFNKNSQSNLVTDYDIDGWNFSIYDTPSLLWGKTLFDVSNLHKAKPKYRENLSLTLVGHTPYNTSNNIKLYQSHLFLDGGYCFNVDNCMLNLYEIQTKTLHQMSVQGNVYVKKLDELISS